VRLLLDAMCGGLRSYLRMCGHDAAYALDGSVGDRPLEADDALLALADREDRTLLTRDVGLAARASDAVLLESREPIEQLRELRAAGVPLDLASTPTRCGRCNGPLVRVDEGASPPDYAPDPSEEPCWRCRSCGRWFWKGSHWRRVATTLADL
jgi:hypothetical protein